jgi:putative glycosyltransferase (TIGR04372 family)
MKRIERHEPITKRRITRMLLNFIIGFGFVFAILLVRPLKKIYFAPLPTSRIGHFVLDTEILLARIYYDQKNSKKNFKIIWIPEFEVSNYYVFSIWRQKLNAVNFNLLTASIMETAIILEKITKIKFTYRFIGWDGYLQYAYLLENSPTVFRMPVSDEIECIDILESNGIDTTKSWVCILARDDQYLMKRYPDLQWDFNSYRNSDINTFNLAAEFLSKNSINVFRMGSIVDKPFLCANDRTIIDYANKEWRNEKLDIYLASRCFFFMSTGTGLDAVAVASRRPLLWVNQAQPLHVYRSKKNFKFITKYFYLKNKNTYLSPKAYFNLGVKEGFTVDNPLHLRAQDLERLGIYVQDNTSSEINEITIEMYNSLIGQQKNYSVLSELQQSFWKSFPQDKRLDISGNTYGEIGKDFLDKNPWLLDD